MSAVEPGMMRQIHYSHQRRVNFHHPSVAAVKYAPEPIEYIQYPEQILQLGNSGAFMAATMLAGNPQHPVSALSSPTAWDQDIMAHLSPNSQYDHSSTDDIEEFMNGSPTQLSPQSFNQDGAEGCNSNWMMTHGHYSGIVYPSSSPYMTNNGGQSPDSGIYSPNSSPNNIDLSSATDSRLQTSCATLSTLPLPPLSTTAGDPTQGYHAITTSPSFHQHPPELFAVPSSTSLTPYSQAPLPYDNMMLTTDAGIMSGYPQTYSPEHNSLDPIPIISCDQAAAGTGNPIRFYSDCNTATELSPRPFVDPLTSPCATGYPTASPFHNITKPEQPVKEVKRPRRPKPQVQVDPSDIKDVPASAQLWEFLLKVLKKPKYNYMVSWESRKDGLFRFHDPSAFAALWGRHRNRPNMTYDKVARALRYYYRREILEPVGGRLTYKFTPRLCKQFMDKHHHNHHHQSTTSTTTTTTTTSTNHHD